MSGANKGWWTPAREVILKRQYPLIGTAVSKILGNTPKACEERARVLGVKRIFKTGKPRQPPSASSHRNKRSCYGYIPGGAVVSVFDLAKKFQPAARQHN